ncbi:MAG TPA: hypothetical protein DCP28_10745, partial [Cytophagales bacterium]|nr:hypothetical protein [Cytophagales bacterium]
MLKAIIRIGLLGALLLGNFPIIAQSLGHSTDSHDASIAYTQGWQAIMDYGQYTQSEVYFREALAHDPDFLLAACQVARLSKDSLERVQLLDQVQAGLGSVPADEQALLANFVELMILTNLRESSTATQAEISAQAQKALRLAEENLRGLVRKYKDEVYYISEYIEVINYNHGPQAALDTLADMDHTRLLNAVPFLMGYRAQLYADLGKTAKADEYLYQR